MNDHLQNLAHPSHFRDAMRVLAAGVAIITMQGEDDKPMGMTATSLTSFSVDPPSILFCVHQASSMATRLQAGLAVGVNILAGDQAPVAEAFAGRTSARGADRFAVGGWAQGAFGVPLLAGARMTLECRITEVIERYTHHIVIAAVHAVHHGPADASGLIADSGHMTAFHPDPARRRGKGGGL